MYRVYVWRTNDNNEPLCCCMSRAFGTIELAKDFAFRQNKKNNRKAEIHLTN